MVESECCPNLYGVPTARGFVGMRFFYPHVVPPGHVSIIGFFASNPMNFMVRVSITYPLYRYADGSWEFCPSREGRNMGRNGELDPGLPCREVRNMAESGCFPNLYGVPTARGFVGMRFFYLYVVPPGHNSTMRTGG